MVGKKIYKRLVQYLQAREVALGEPAVAPAPADAPVRAPVAVGATRNGADGAAGPGPVPSGSPIPPSGAADVTLNRARARTSR